MITLEIPLLAFCACVCESSENTAYRNFLEFTNKPMSRLNFWLKFDNSKSFFPGASKYWVLMENQRYLDLGTVMILWKL